MAKKKPSLAGAMKTAQGAEAGQGASTTDTISKQPSATKQQPSRKGTKAVTGHFDPAVSKQLKLISIETENTMQVLLAEAINDLFHKYGKKPIA